MARGRQECRRPLKEGELIVRATYPSSGVQTTPAATLGLLPRKAAALILG